MAERRMFAKTIIDSDAFIDMPQSSQNLYFHLSMRADDEGFINSPKTIMRSIGCKDDDMNILIMKKFIIPFENGIVVIKHWKIHNYIQSDRYTPTKYLEQKKQLELDENKAYRISTNECIHDVYTMDTQVRLGKVSIGKDNNTLCKSVIDYLNEKTDRKFTSSKAHCLHINARIEEGHTLDEFEKVVDTMCSKWINDKNMSQYLRPSTLFGTKFESYLNSAPKPKDTDYVMRDIELI